MHLGTRLGPYDIVSLLGAGGMGEVYRATDTNLKRQVALKVLPASVAADADRLARFQREAEVLAALNHPYIAQIYGIELSAGATALVMELVEGEDLSARIARGAIPLDEALPIARQIAEALEAAHEQGIVHRDLKPANIKVRPDGTVKVLDFGLAKAMEPAAASGVAAHAATITTPAMTQAGMILGTAAYMAPEQAKGRPVDKRADIWAFGAVLYEMLTGRRAFEGEDIAEVLSRVLQREPDLAALPAATPSRVRELIARCLVKDPRQRLRDIGDARLVLDGAFDTQAPEGALGGASGPVAASRRTPRLGAVAAAAVAGMLALVWPALQHLRETPPAPPPQTRLDIATPPSRDPSSFALSPDGTLIAFVAADGGTSRLWVRSLATGAAQALPGTDDARLPFWSPDGRSLGFFAADALKRVDLGGAAPRVLAPVQIPFGGTWTPEGHILFVGMNEQGLRRVSAAGGTVEAVALRAQPPAGPRWPQSIAGGRVLFSADDAEGVAGIYLGVLETGEVTRLMSSETAGRYVAPGWLLWVRDGTLAAQRLDLERAALSGDAVDLADGLIVTLRGHSAVAVSDTGLVAYRTGRGRQRQLTWFDRAGVVRGTLGEASDLLASLRLSPDGRRVAVAREVAGNTDLWLVDESRASRFTFEAGIEAYPLWTPDGARILFLGGGRDAAPAVYQKDTNGAGTEQRLVGSDRAVNPNSVSPDGRFLLYQRSDRESDADLMVVPLGAEPTPSVFLKTPFREAYGAFSPDGRWVAYHSNESGRTEIYIRAFVPPGSPVTTTAGQWQVSTAGGVFARWAPDGRELYYLDPAGVMMAAPIAVTGSVLAAGRPVALFTTRIANRGADQRSGWHYDVAPDGRFLINTEQEDNAAPITLLSNWKPPTP